MSEPFVKSKERNLVFRIAEYGLKKRFFTLKELFEALDLKDKGDDSLSRDFIVNSLTSKTKEQSQNVNHLIITVANPSKTRTETFLPNAIVQYADYPEIVEA